MRGARKTELASAYPAPPECYGDDTHNYQRHNLLPIHRRQHNLNSALRNGEFGNNFCKTAGKNRPPFRLCTFCAHPYAAPMAAAPFSYLHRVTYAECTVGNHVYYARHLDLLEAARGAFFRELGASFLQWQERDAIFPVIECRLRYKTPARYDDTLTIELWPTAIERVRLNFTYRITNQANLLILKAETFHVCAGLNEKPKRLPEELVGQLRPYLRNAESGI